MAEPVIFQSLSQIEDYRQKIRRNLSATMDALGEILKREEPFAFFHKMKYEKFSKEPSIRQ